MTERQRGEHADANMMPRDDEKVRNRMNFEYWGRGKVDTHSTSDSRVDPLWDKSFFPVPTSSPLFPLDSFQPARLPAQSWKLHESFLSKLFYLGTVVSKDF